jgi:hypothetical protein
VRGTIEIRAVLGISVTIATNIAAGARNIAGGATAIVAITTNIAPGSTVIGAGLMNILARTMNISLGVTILPERY